MGTLWEVDCGRVGGEMVMCWLEVVGWESERAAGGGDVVFWVASLGGLLLVDGIVSRGRDAQSRLWLRLPRRTSGMLELSLCYVLVDDEVAIVAGGYMRMSSTGT